MADSPVRHSWLLWSLLVVAGGSVAIYWVLGELNDTFRAPTLIGSLIVFFGYFTILTNTLSAVMAGTLLFGRGGRLHRFFSSASVQTAVSAYILFVGVGRWTLLGAPGDDQIIGGWIGWIPEIGTHAGAPLLGLLWFLIGVPHGQLGWGDAVRWLAYPAAYYAFWVVAGPFLPSYPYPFMDFPTLGLVGSITWLLVLAAAALVFSFGFLGIDRILGRRSTAGPPLAR